MKRVLVYVACTAVSAAIAPAQTMVEHSAITAGSTMGATGMRGAGEAAAKILENAGKALGQASSSGRSAAGGTQGQTSIIAIPHSDDKQPKPNAPVPDAKAIPAGMTADQLTLKFGAPAMKVNGAASETWFYGSTPDELTIELKAGKVVSVTPPKKQPAVRETAKSETRREQPDTGVVIIQ
jgi:hypothetical protein